MSVAARATSTSSSRVVVERVVERDGPRRGNLLRVLGARERDVRGVDHERRRAIRLDRDRDGERGDLDVRVRQRWDLGRHRARNHARERRGVGGVVSEGRATSALGRGRTGLSDVCGHDSGGLRGHAWVSSRATVEPTNGEDHEDAKVSRSHDCGAVRRQRAGGFLGDVREVESEEWARGV